MKKVLFTLGFFAATLFAVNAQENSSSVANANAPEMKFEEEIHDYGTINQGVDGAYFFKFKNVGKEPLIISNARGSCGCTVPEWPKEPIKPGANGQLK